MIKKPILIIIFTVILAISVQDSSEVGIIEAKKAYEINSPKVCGDKLCSDISVESTKTQQDRQNADSPLGQYQLGITLDKIRCKVGYELVIKASNWNPACVNPSNVEKLIKLRWAVSSTEQKEIIKLAMSGYSFDIIKELGISEPNATEIIPETLPDMDFSLSLSIQPEFQNDQRSLIFTGHGWRGFHVVTIQITNDKGYFYELETKTTQRGDLFMPWIVPDDLTRGWYHIRAFIGEGQFESFEIDIPIASAESITLKETNFTNDRCTTVTFPIDWSGCDLYGRVLAKTDLRNANLQGANLYGATLNHKDLTGADFTSAILKKANLDGTILRGAIFVNANLIDADVRNADLSNAILRNAELIRTDFTNSNLTNADLRHSTLTYAVLAFADLKGANLGGAGTWQTNLNHCYNHPICQ